MGELFWDGSWLLDTPVIAILLKRGPYASDNKTQELRYYNCGPVTVTCSHRNLGQRAHGKVILSCFRDRTCSRGRRPRQPSPGLTRRSLIAPPRSIARRKTGVLSEALWTAATIERSTASVWLSRPGTPALPALREAYCGTGAQIAHAVEAWV